MKALITGSNGFVGHYLTKELIGSNYDVYGIDINKSDVSDCLDIMDIQALHDYLENIKPDYIFHLAAIASVGFSWNNPQLTFDLNVRGTINILEVVRELELHTKLIIIGSADQYGVSGVINEPINEKYPTNPKNPYAISKKAQEEIALLYAKSYGMEICLTRSFNHTGPGQKLGFMVPDFCSEIVSVERGQKKVIKVGNLDARRDFSDVRDVVKAYRLIAEKGVAGEIYNVGSGNVYSVKEVLDILISMAKVGIHSEIDSQKIRPIETPLIMCDNKKLLEHTRFVPYIRIEDTLKDTLEYYRGQF